MHILIVGLPKAVGQLIDVFAKRAGMNISRVYANPGNQGSFILLPRPEHCLPEVHRYLDSFGHNAGNYEGSHVLVLPYAKVPQDCLEELNVAEEMGAVVTYAALDGHSMWPTVSRRKPADHQFNVALSNRIQEYLKPFLGEVCELPSEFVRQLAKITPSFLIASNALDECDRVAPHRFDFIRRSAIALSDALTQGLSNRFEDHCSDRGLHHAQNGGSKFTVVVSNGSLKDSEIICQTHIKQGDKTTKQAAARVYYTFLTNEDVLYVALLYAGPHPHGDYKCTVSIPSLV